MVATKIIKKIIQGVNIVVIGLFSVGLTLFVFLNSFEVLFNKDIPFIHALDTWPAERSLEGTAQGGPRLRDWLEKTPDNIGNFGSPKTIKIPILGGKMSLIRAINVDDQWLYRANDGQYIIVSQPKNGNMGDLVVYADSSWRTILNPGSLRVGNNIFVDTDSGWRYMFRIINRSVLHVDDPYVKSETPLNTLVLFFKDEKGDLVFVTQGVFVTIQSLQQ